jgi:hypothetical protein
MIEADIAGKVVEKDPELLLPTKKTHFSVKSKKPAAKNMNMTIGKCLNA